MWDEEEAERVARGDVCEGSRGTTRVEVEDEKRVRKKEVGGK